MKPADTMLERTRRMLTVRPDTLTLERIAREAELPYHWLVSVSQGRTRNPGVITIERLHNYLAARVETGTGAIPREA